MNRIGYRARLALPCILFGLAAPLSFLEEKVVLQTELLVRLNHVPRAKSVPEDAHEQTRVLERAPLAVPVECRLEIVDWYTPFEHIVDLLEHLDKQTQLVVPDNDRLGVDPAYTAEVEQHRTLA